MLACMCRSNKGVHAPERSGSPPWAKLFQGLGGSLPKNRHTCQAEVWRLVKDKCAHCRSATTLALATVATIAACSVRMLTAHLILIVIAIKDDIVVQITGTVNL